MKIHGPWGLLNHPTHAILCENEEEKTAVINYINENFEQYKKILKQ